ncbi:MAG: preprotein translocase subunit SecA [Clostridia bacterium]|nr:preprotein translocase subunit SecA [Clostridia bacterium]
MGLIEKIFGSYSDKQIKKITPVVDKIEALAEKYKAMSDSEMRAVTDSLKAELEGGKTLDDILPDAYALVREAADRVLGKRPFRVQLMCAVLLHQGRVAEMKTGEGKTLVAVMPSYLNALSGKGVHVVTVNEYLAKMGQEEMGRVHEFLGLTTGLVIHDQTRKEKKAAYNCDITYGTNNEFGFDYLRDNMVTYKENQVQRGHNFAIVDEVDSILIDEARTPLIISGHGSKIDELYGRADSLVRRMSKYVIKEMDTKVEYDTVEQDYVIDEKARNCTLTANGIKKAEEFFGIENFSDPENANISHHVYQAMRAHGIMKRDTDYVIKDNEVLIVDSFTGRIMPGRRYSDGLHQAIEAKEGVEIQRENRTIATITFQNYFRMYKKLSGMTGTALSEKDEFEEIYSLDVVVVPTNKPMIRVDHSDVVYTSVAGKERAIIEQIKQCHEKGQPVLVGTVSVEKSELLSRKLKACGIPHNVLNAKFHEKEAEIVAQAGKLGAVTISTNMAGRGTDILLGGNAEFLAKVQMRKEGYEEEVIMLATGSSQSVSEEVFAARAHFRELYDKYQEEIRPEAEKVCEAGGLFVIGTERHEARRIDNQLRGRSGRQGDPGESRFYLSMQDDLMRLFGSERVLGIISAMGVPEDTPIDAKILSNSIESAQKHLEDQNFQRRKNVIAYDDVMNLQRKKIYEQRQDVLEGVSLKESIVSWIKSNIEYAVEAYLAAESLEDWDIDGLINKYVGLLCRKEDFESLPDNAVKARESVRELMTERAMAIYEDKEQNVFGEEQFREVERVILLRNVDQKWMDHLEAMDSLMESVGLQAYAQRNPISEYRLAGDELFGDLVEMIHDDTVRMILTVMPKPQQLEREQVAKPVTAGFAGKGDGTLKKKPVVRKPEDKVGRNDPCPCGSGKKYKKCCGSATASAED